MQEDTISAVATAVGEGGIGVVRLSGKNALNVAARLFQSSTQKDIERSIKSQIYYGHIVDPKDNSLVDEVLLLVMKAPHSYTREDVVEIQCHGGSVVLRRILGLTLRSGARLAEPGEFTKRAFLNGRLDLTQAEAVIDIIRAKTDASLKMAIGHLEGELAGKINQLRGRILEMIAQLEATIDFPEENIEELPAESVNASLQKIVDEIESLLSTSAAGRILQDGLQTVIIGKPNVGKSSLLNALLRENRAIVTDVPGTTRDSIEEFVNLRGIPLRIVDTAGIRDTSDEVEKIGVDRSRAFVERADLVLVLLDASQPLSQEDHQVLSLLADRKAIILINKSDLPEKLVRDELAGYVGERQIITISVAAGLGLDVLEQCIAEMVFQGSVGVSEGAFINNVRQENILRLALQNLMEAKNTIVAGLPADFQVIDLRSAWEKLGELSGETVSEDIINEIFSRFCIGK
ncbi:MAG: mnmE 1 [Firmicutes bacterium]|nr:mnmE 1 [Bacillota bacterium]